MESPFVFFLDVFIPSCLIVISNIHVKGFRDLVEKGINLMSFFTIKKDLRFGLKSLKILSFSVLRKVVFSNIFVEFGKFGSV